MSEFHKFVSNIPSSKYVFKSGKVANFVGGQYLTEFPEEIKELDAEIAMRHPHISRDKNELTVSSEKADPLASYRAKIIAEYVASQKAAVDPTNDFGKSSVSGSGMQTSSTLGGISAASNKSK